ncbi:multidrug effflux MFS transporter [Sphaerisporangium sp. NPDC088356]|uniref:multidrug effflux MFS transporter n=1 Tax=Sphaerisporangium sp. NPDC088356 TaxID=3154871 RepID=UPI00343D79C0
MSATATLSAPRATGPAPLLVAVLGLLSAFQPFALYMYLPGFVPLARDLRTSAIGVQLTLSAFLLGVALGQFSIGALSDRLGRRAPLLVCLALCTVAGAVCALAPAIGVLIAARFVQGLAGSAAIVAGRAIVTDTGRGRDAARVFGILMAVLGVAPVVAPLAGGIVAGTAGWRGVFAALALLSLLMFLAALVAVPETLPKHRRGAVDLHATARVVRGLLLDGPFLGYALAFTFAFGALMAYVAASPFVLGNLFGLTTATFSLAFAINALGLFLVSTVNARLVYRFSPHRLLQTGLAILFVAAAALCVLAVTGLLSEVTGLPLLLVAVSSLGLVLGNAAALALGRAPHSAVTASALLGTLQFAFGALVAPLAGLRGDRSAVPMALVMDLCAVLALLALALTRNALDLTPGERPDAERAGMRSCDQRG